MPPWASFLVICGLAVVHLFAAELPFLARQPRSLWLSLAGGVPVAYVFLQILPALARDQQTVMDAATPAFSALKNHLYLVALLGLLTFYGVERAVKAAHRPTLTGENRPTLPAAFWFSITSVSVINFTIGYLLVQQERGMRGVALFFVAFALKFTVDDYSLHKAHEAAYDRIGRWIVVAALFTGWAVAATATVPPVAVALLRAFLAGGILLNALKEELPGGAGGHFWAFALGVVGYAVLLLAA